MLRPSDSQMLRPSDPQALRPSDPTPINPPLPEIVHTHPDLTALTSLTAPPSPLARIYLSVTRKGPPVDPTDLA